MRTPTNLRGVAHALVWVFVFTVPWEDSVVLPGLGTVGRATGLLAGAGGLAVILFEGRRYRLLDTHVLTAAFAAWVCASILWSADAPQSFLLVSTMLQLLFMVLLVWEFGREQADRRRLLWAYVLGCYVSCINTFFVYAAAIGTVSDGSERRFAASGFNEDDLGTILALGVPMAWYLALRAERRSEVALARVYIVVAITAVVLTATRGSFLTLLAGAAILPLTWRRLPGRAQVLSFGALALALLLVAVVVPDDTLGRLGTIPAELAGGSLNGRRQLWGAALEVLTEHPVVGVGVGGSAMAIERLLGFNERPHNSFLSVAADLGVIGIVLFSLVLLSVALRTTAFPSPERAFAQVLLLCLVLASLSVHWEYRKPTWLVIALVLIQQPVTEGLAPALSRARRREWR